MKPFLLAVILIYGFLNARSQDTAKNIHPQTPHTRSYYREAARASRDSISRGKKFPTIFATGGFGTTIIANETVEAAFQAYWDLNYQYKRNLFTVREVYIITSRNPHPGDPEYNVINLPIVTGHITQYALLYGRRLVNDHGHALSFSAGISTNDNFLIFKGPATHAVNISRNYAGIPFEVNYGWYARYLGPSFGFKLTGDISRYSFVGLGFDVGLGLHNPREH